MKKLPPLEKIYEAYSAITDGRVTLLAAEGRALVASSAGGRQYTVSWDGDAYSSNDSASYWQGYAGYPVIAVLMVQGRLPLDKAIAAQFAGVNWNERNKTHKRDYARAAASVIEERGLSAAQVSAAATKARAALEDLSITLTRGARRPG